MDNPKDSYSVISHASNSGQRPAILSSGSYDEAHFDVPAHMEVSYSGGEHFIADSVGAVQKPGLVPYGAVMPVPMCHVVEVDWAPAEEMAPAEQPETPWKGQVVNSNTSTQLPAALGQGSGGVSRTRRKKRPFSPELISGTSKKILGKTKSRKKAVLPDKETLVQGTDSKPFSCDNCHSSFVVDPGRCRLPFSQLRKKPTHRRKVDPKTKKTLTLCNACGIAFSRPQKNPKDIQPTPTVEDREKYLAEAIAFAKTVAQRVQDPVAERLYCPSFTSRPCGCVQSYLSNHGDGTENTSLESRVSHLLHFLKTACRLGRRKNIFPETTDAEHIEGVAVSDGTITFVEKKQRLRQLEQFIFDTRQHLREKLRLCERACQRILLYSNNFLHKRLKSAPDQGSRLSRQPGHSATGSLMSILEVGSARCCSDNCSHLAKTHLKLIEEWRKRSSLGQRQARRVLAEMLTPSGGTKANCYKFIAMVTGCSFSTISAVSQQMRKTKGDREPPEHGLKKWHREHPKIKSNAKAAARAAQCDHSYEAAVSMLPAVVSIHIPNSEELAMIEGPEATQKLQEQRQQLEEAKQQLALKQQEIKHCQQLIDQQLRLQNSLYQQASLTVWKGSNNTNPVKHAECLDTQVPAKSNSDVTFVHNGEVVQLLDIMPGTYVAVSSDPNNSTLLTADPKVCITNVETSGAVENIHTNQVMLGPRVINNVPSIEVEDNVTIGTRNSAPTYYNMVTMDVGPLQTILDSQSAQQTIHYLEIPSTEFSGTSEQNSGHTSNISFMTPAGQLQPLCRINEAHPKISLLTAEELQPLSLSPPADHTVISVVTSGGDFEHLQTNDGPNSCHSVVNSGDFRILQKPVDCQKNTTAEASSVLETPSELREPDGSYSSVVLLPKSHTASPHTYDGFTR